MDIDELIDQAPAKRKFNDPLEKVPDGKYPACITHTDFVDTDKFIKFIIEFDVETSQTTSVKSKKEFYLSKGEQDKDKVIKFASDVKETLKKLGLDSENWTAANKRKLADEFLRSRPVMVGMQIEIGKKGSEKDGRVYVNVYKRLLDDNKQPLDGKPLEIGQAEITAAFEEVSGADPFGD